MATIFTKIINREIPATIVFENDKVIAFKDINPAAPVHILVVPKKEISTINDIKPEDKDIIGEISKYLFKIRATTSVPPVEPFTIKISPRPIPIRTPPYIEPNIISLDGPFQVSVRVIKKERQLVPYKVLNRKFLPTNFQPIISSGIFITKYIIPTGSLKR